MSAVTVATHVPESSLRHELGAIRTVCRRELIRFAKDRTQMLMALIQPLLFEFVLGSGLQSLSRPSPEDLTTFLFPGVVCMVVLFTAILRSASLVWDRELGFLKEMVVAPVSRASILIGKGLGGTVIAMSQGMLLLALAPLADVPYDLPMLLGVLVLLVPLAFLVTAFGLWVAVRIKQAQSFTSMMQMVVMPAFFASGAFFPVDDLPRWLEVVNRLNPLTYAVDPVRRTVFDRLDAPAAGVDWWGWTVPLALEVGLVLAVGGTLLGAATLRFEQPE